MGLIGMILASVVSLRGVQRVRLALVAENGPRVSDAFRAVRSSAALTASLRLRIAIAIGILGLMTIKPDAVHSSLILAAAVVAGLIATMM